MIPSGEAAKNRRSVKSSARVETGRGNWKVVRRDVDSKSHIYERDQLVRGELIPDGTYLH